MFLTFDILINYTVRYTLSDSDKVNMTERGYTPGDPLSEKAWLEWMVRARPEMLIEAYVRAGALTGAWNNSQMLLPITFATATQVVV